MRDNAIKIAMAVLAQLEGLRLVPYKDIVGVPTVCYGETSKSEMSSWLTYTPEECENKLKMQCNHIYDVIQKTVSPTVYLNDYQIAALISFIYNIGETNWKSNKNNVRKHINRADFLSAEIIWLQYNKGKINGKYQVIKGLENRRKIETELFFYQA